MSEETKLLEEMDSDGELQELKGDLANIGICTPTYEELRRAGVEKGEAKLRTTKFFIEASDEERHHIWEKNHEKHKWEEDNSGIIRMIGTFGKDKFEVHVSFFFAKMNGARICFYNATSRYVDHTLVDKYIENNYPIKYDGTRRAMTDAANFHNVFDVCKRKNKHRNPKPTDKFA